MTAQKLGRRVGILAQALLVVLLKLWDFVTYEMAFGHEALGVSASFDVRCPRRQLLRCERGLYYDGHYVRVPVVVTFMIVQRFLGRRLAAARRAHEITGHLAAASFEMFFHVVDAIRDVTAVLKMTSNEPVFGQHNRPRLDVHWPAAPLPEQPLDRCRWSR